MKYQAYYNGLPYGKPMSEIQKDIMNTQIDNLKWDDMKWGVNRWIKRTSK